MTASDYWIDEGKNRTLFGNYEGIRDDLYDFMIDDMHNTLRKLIF